jgi:hypothetical protein
MIAMAVGKHDMGHIRNRRGAVRNEGRIVGEERINQHRLAGEVEPKGGMAEPRNVHRITPLLLAGSNDDRPAAIEIKPRWNGRLDSGR